MRLAGNRREAYKTVQLLTNLIELLNFAVFLRLLFGYLNKNGRYKLSVSHSEFLNSLASRVHASISN